MNKVCFYEAKHKAKVWATNLGKVGSPFVTSQGAQFHKFMLNDKKTIVASQTRLFLLVGSSLAG